MSIPEAMDLIWTLLEVDGSTARAINDGPVWGVSDYLAADQVEALTGQPHPARPKKSSISQRQNDPAFIAARERARARRRDRQQRLADGKIT